ncbi:MAG: transcriptional regulator [Thermosphaera sp.]
MPKNIFELAYRYVEPSIKRLIVLKLVEKNIPPIAIAEKLGVSPSLVSRYMKGERGMFLDVSKNPGIMERVEQVSEKIARGELEGVSLQIEVNKVVLKTLADKHVCGLHKLVDETVNPVTCNICPTLFAGAIK